MFDVAECKMLQIGKHFMNICTDFAVDSGSLLKRLLCILRGVRDDGSV